MGRIFPGGQETKTPQVVLGAIGTTLNYSEGKRRRIRYENTDCFEFLPTVKSKTVDLVLIDPPYHISRKTNFRNSPETNSDTDRFRISMDFGQWDNEQFEFDYLFKELYRVLRDGGTLISFFDLWKITELRNWLESAKFKQIRFFEWIKTNPVPINSKINYLTNAREIGVVGVKKGKPTFKCEYDNGIYNYPTYHGNDRFHPTQKPLKLIEDLITKHSNPGDTVLDCFCGSGTTVVACENTGRNFIGCEISEEYFSKSLERLQLSRKG